jgi:hypothetical protein
MMMTKQTDGQKLKGLKVFGLVSGRWFEYGRFSFCKDTPKQPNEVL